MDARRIKTILDAKPELDWVAPSGLTPLASLQVKKFRGDYPGTETQGVVLCNQIRTVDLEARGAKRVESVPEVVMDDVLARIQVLIE